MSDSEGRLPDRDERSAGWRLTRWFARLSTGSKMVFVLGFASLPLGGVAILSSLNSAYTSRVSDVTEAQAALSISGQRVSSAIARSALLFRIASGIAARAPVGGADSVCERTTTQLSDYRLPNVRFVLYAPDFRISCASQDYRPTPLTAVASTSLSRFRISPDGTRLTIVLYGANNQPEAQFEVPVTSLAPLAATPGNRMPIEMELAADDGNVMPLLRTGAMMPERQVSFSEAMLSGRLELRLRASPEPLSAQEWLLILLPVLLWFAAAIIGWFVVQRLLVNPLVRMQRAIAAYSPGERGFVMPERRGLSPEIADLGGAFEEVTRTVARHEADLEAGIERQTRLVREVHHRVKNNLQVVASLLNLHSRGTTNAEVGAAYASIQRRVDALAVVHRNHYAELEENRGVALKALISELGASLRASAPAGATSMQIRLAIEPLYATQDVAVSIAFLMTEVVEFAMLSGSGPVSITLEGIGADPNRARLTLESNALTADEGEPSMLKDRFERIVTGLSRQLRSEIERTEGRYSLTIAVVGKADA